MALSIAAPSYLPLQILTHFVAIAGADLPPTDYGGTYFSEAFYGSGGSGSGAGNEHSVDAIRALTATSSGSGDSHDVVRMLRDAP